MLAPFWSLWVGTLLGASAGLAFAADPSVSVEVMQFHCKPSVTRQGQGVCRGELVVRLDTQGAPAKDVLFRCSVPLHYEAGMDREPGLRTLELEARTNGQGTLAEHVFAFETDLTSVVRETRNTRVGTVRCRAHWRS